MATTELTVIDSWIYSQLAGDTALTALIGTSPVRAYRDLAPQVDEQSPTTVYPCVVWQVQSQRPDLMTVGAIRVWSEGLYLIRAIAETRSYGGDLEAMAKRLDALFHDVRGTVSGGLVISSVRQQPFQQGEFTNGRHYRHFGGLYEVRGQVS